MNESFHHDTIHEPLEASQPHDSVSVEGYLPNFIPLPPTQNPFGLAIPSAYDDEVVGWKPNLFHLPSWANCSNKFLDILSNLFRTASNSEGYALTATFVLPALLLQNPFRKSKLKDHVSCLERRLLLWKEESGIIELLREGRAIQRHLHHTKRTMDASTRLPISLVI